MPLFKCDLCKCEWQRLPSIYSLVDSDGDRLDLCTTCANALRDSQAFTVQDGMIRPKERGRSLTTSTGRGEHKKLDRARNWLYALIHGYYWTRCPLCGEFYGGHESAGAGLMISWVEGESVCKWCEEEARQRNKAFMAMNPPPPAIWEDR